MSSSLEYPNRMNQSDDDWAESGPYKPNHISLDTRAWYLVVSALIVSYSVASLLRDDFYIWFPGGRGKSIDEHLRGNAAWLAAAAALCGCANMLSVVVDHYDKRNNETNYRAFAKWSLGGAAALLLLAFVAHGINLRYGR